MVSLKLHSNRKKIDVKSRDIKILLEASDDIENCQDISDTINEEDILVFDCQLSKELFSAKYDLEALIEALGEEVDDGYFDMFYEDVRDYIKGFSDDIEAEIQEKYGFDDVRCNFNIYSINQDFDDFKFIFIVAFKKIEIKKLNSIAQILGKRRLLGASKFYS
ncbi:hypothetical protein [Peptacetobacter sp.]|uniref:hypothetical protein n=1 Tax=Peptacetobacter sp. TaxID=2991975 RepID=UPI002621490C|nr:hypothetical protein [Peptacetobacter sp.]